MSDSGLQGSIDNLLVNCIGAMPGQRLLIVQEPEGEAMYDRRLGQLISAQATDRGIQVSETTTPLIKNPDEICTQLSAQMRNADHTLFMSRIGDVARFTPLSGEGSKTVCYARQLHMLESAYASSCHKLMSTLLDRVETELMQARGWRITCALGTDISGEFVWNNNKKTNDFSLSLFPVTTFCPVACENAVGNVALSRWLMPGGATKVGDHYIPFPGIVNATVEQGCITGFDGSTEAMKIVENHYDAVSAALGTNRNRVHSWHAGINPHTFFDGIIESDFEGWNAISFSSPRYLHFHTCGDVAPCEITWSVFNPTVSIDGVDFWKDGEFCWLQRPDNRDFIQGANQQNLLQPSAPIGL